jgi:hypothetical protein
MSNTKTLEQIKEQKAHVEKMILTVLRDFETSTGTEVTGIDWERIKAIGKPSEIMGLSMDIKIG